MIKAVKTTYHKIGFQNSDYTKQIKLKGENQSKNWIIR